MTDRLRPPTKRARRVAIYGSIFLFTAAEFAIHLLIPPLLATDLRLDPAGIGAVVGTFALASLLARLPIGMWYTPQRAPLLVGLGGGLATVCYAFVPLVEHPVAIAGLLALDGIGWSAATTALLAGLSDVREEGRSTASTMGWYLGFIGLGNAAAGVGGILADAAGIRTAFLLLAVFPALATVAAGLALRGLTGRHATERHDVEVPGDADHPAPAHDLMDPATVVPRVPRRSWLGSLRDALDAPLEVWAAALVMLYINTINGMLNAFHPVIALASGLSLSEIGILSSTRSLFSSWIRLGSGALFARIRADRLTTPLLLVGTLSIVAVPPVVGSFWLQVPLFAAAGLARGLLRVSGSALAFDAVPPRSKAAGVTSAIIQAGLDLGKLAGPVLGGVIAQVVGISSTFVILPVGLALAYAAIRAAMRRRVDCGPAGRRLTAGRA